MCDNNRSGDAAHNYSKHCICVAEAAPCASEGEECDCTGTVYYGGKDADLVQMKDSGDYTEKTQSGTALYDINRSGDPAHGYSKHYICVAE